MTDAPLRDSHNTLDLAPRPPLSRRDWLLAAAGCVAAAGMVYAMFQVVDIAVFGLLIGFGMLWFLLARRLPLLRVNLGPFLAVLAVLAFFILAELLQKLWGWHRQDDGTSLGRFLLYFESTLWKAATFRTVISNSLVVAVAALGMTVIMIAGGIDLSVGNAISLCAVVLAFVLRETYDPLRAVAACLLAGMAAGALNGLLISGLKLMPFIATLGTMMLFIGCARFLSEDSTLRPPQEAIPQAMADIVRPAADVAVGGVPLGFWILIALAAALTVVLKFTVFGRHVFAIGSNEQTARLCGINVPATKIAVYALSGLFVGIAGIFMFGNLKNGNPTSGQGMELEIIAAVVIGGGSLNGGRGSPIGAIAGALIVQMINTGCTTGLGLPDLYQKMIVGLIIIVAVALDQVRQRRAALG